MSSPVAKPPDPVPLAIDATLVIDDDHAAVVVTSTVELSE